MMPQAIDAPTVPAPPIATEATLSLGGLGGLTDAMPQIVAQSTIGGKFNAYALLVAVLSNKMFWVAAAALFGAVCTYIYRKRHHA